jgi:hypothetical protein
MRTRIRRVGALLLTVAALAACDLPPMVSDTGYRGTWSRGNDRNVSIVAIAEVGGRWFFRWTKRSFDGKLAILCDWGGRCEERLNGTLVATYAMTTRYDAAAGKLYTDTVEERVVPDKQAFRYTDVMEVKDGGRTLWNYTIDRDGQHYEGTSRPQRSFTKIANSVADPPRPERR